MRPGSTTTAGLAASGVVFLAAAAALAAIAFGPLRGDGFSGIDSAVKFIQAGAFRASGFRSMSLPYPGGALDPDGVFLPFDSPYVFPSATGYESIFPAAFAVLASLLVGFGPGAIRLLSIAGGALAVVAAAWLSDRPPRWMVAAIFLAATPLWFYATPVGEPALALAASTLAFVAARGTNRRADLLTGLLVGTAAIFRDESLLLVPGLLYARRRYAGPKARLAWLLGGVAAPVVLMGLVDWAWLHRPVLAHLRHAVPMLNAVLPRSRAMLPHLPPLLWSERYETIVHYWWLGGGTRAIALAVVVALLVALALRRRAAGPLVVLAILSLAVAWQAQDLVRLVAAPKFLPGLLRLAPFLIFAFLPAAPDAPPSSTRRVAIVTALTFTALAWVTLNTAAGKGLGPRLTLGLWPLLIAAAWEGLLSWWHWTGPRVLRTGIVVAGVLMVAGSMVMELGIALPAWAARTREDRQALAFIRGIPDQVVVLDDDVNMQLVGSEFFRRRVLFVARPDLWAGLGARAASSGETRLLVVSRSRSPQIDIPPFRFAEEWTVTRYWIGRWVR
jgi:hypothetical protein